MQHVPFIKKNLDSGSCRPKFGFKLVFQSDKVYCLTKDILLEKVMSVSHVHVCTGSNEPM